jgi:hypothetical protein
MSDEKVTIGGALSFAWSLWTENWRAIWGVLAFYALSATILNAGQLAKDPRLIVAGCVAALIADFPTNGAIFRLAFAKEAGDRPDFRLGTLGLQWRGMEWRMLAASLLLAVFFILVGLLAAVAVSAVIFGVMMARGVPLTTQIDPTKLLPMLGPVGEGAIQLVFFIAVAVMAFLTVRLSLVMVASAVSGRVQVLKSFPLTRGHFWTVFGLRLALWLPAVVLGALLLGGLGEQSQAGLSAGPAFAIALVMGVFSAGVLAPLLAAALAYFYKNLRTPT